MTSVGEVVEQLELSPVAYGNMKQHVRFGKLFRSYS